jgi:hypothetical protein
MMHKESYCFEIHKFDDEKFIAVVDMAEQKYFSRYP